MTEASRGDATRTPSIDWRMSASLENVPCGDADMAEVTSLAGAVRAWRGLDPRHRAAAILTPERALQIDGVSTASFAGEGIMTLSERLPATETPD